MKTLKFAGFLILFFMLFYSFRNFFILSMVTGKYVNTNFENSRTAEIPSHADTLILFDDMTYKSSYYGGEGDYTLNYDFDGTEIHLTYEYQFGKAGITRPMKRSFFGTIEISLVPDLNQYYEKIE